MKEKNRQFNYPEEIKLVPDQIRVQPSTFKEICEMYGLGEKAMKSCLKPIMEKVGPRPGRLFTVHQVEMILQHLGLPYTLKDVG